MTTRRWMVAIAAMALAFGGYRVAKQRRRCLMRATWHAEAAAYHRRSLARVATDAARRARADQVATPLPVTSAEPDEVIEPGFGLPSGRLFRSEGNDRFMEAQARRYALAASRRKILDDYDRRQSAYHARQANYHASLAQKYLDAARYPWLPVEPDPPEPR
jgi:hypothetical protein